MGTSQWKTLESGCLIINEQDVRVALDNLLYHSRSPRPSSLENLALVDQVIWKDGVYSAAPNRAWALSQVLTTFITDALCQQCSILNLAVPIAHLPLVQTLEEIAQESRAGNPEMIGWCWLYYRYVRIELNITPDLFYRTIFCDERTFRRYQQHAIRRLAQRLIEEENRVRHLLHKRHLYAQLPSTIPLVLAGRTEALRCAKQLTVTLHPCHLEITGAPGIGKSAFVQEVVQFLLDHQPIDDLIWLHRPQSVALINNNLTNYLSPPHINLSTREFLCSRRVVIVLDGLDDLPRHDLEELKSLLDTFEQATVFLTARKPLALSNPLGRITLAPLKPSDAKDLIRYLLRSQYVEGGGGMTESDVNWIWMQTRGNPRAIREVISHFYDLSHMEFVEFGA